jgi:hypothetical protein
MGAFVETGLGIRGETEEGVEVDVAGGEEGKGGCCGGEGCVSIGAQSRTSDVMSRWDRLE